MTLSTQALQAIKNEITTDPTNQGYASKTSDSDIATAMNASWIDSNGNSQPSRTNQALNKIPNTPNAIQAQDVTDAKAL